MDSLTQIVLGAAAGEVVLGKKIGNRAMFWGAVGGTIPDLDVLGKFFLSNIDNLAFHRGISHSVVFSIIGALFFGYLVHKVYQSTYHKFVAVFFTILAALLVTSALNYVFERLFVGNYLPIALVAITLSTLVYWNAKKRYFSSTWQAPEATLRDWQWLFFWALFTHPILDCFTMYGTQLFAPFSDMRVAWSSISVADPLYTLPFLCCLIVAATYAKHLRARRFWNYLGIGLSSLYLVFTLCNKQYINHVFAQALAKQQIEVERFVSNPYIFNNIVWNCTVETKTDFYLGQYSWFDEGEISFARVPKNHHLLSDLDSDPTLQTLRWFSDDYFNILPLQKGYQFNDLRFGAFSGKGSGPSDFIFKFLLINKSTSGYHMERAVGGPEKGDEQQMMRKLWERMWGKKS